MSIIKDFKNFALRGNLIDMAVGFTVGAGFTTIAKSLVSDIIMPGVGYVVGNSDFSDLFFILREGKKITGPYPTLKAAQDAGAVTVNYGLFVNNLIAFLMVAIAMFLIIKVIAKLEDAFDEELEVVTPNKENPKEKKCQYCFQIIPFRATRCSYCTSILVEDERK